MLVVCYVIYLNIELIVEAGHVNLECNKYMKSPKIILELI